MDRPRPADPVGYRWNCRMVVRCATEGCGNQVVASVGSWALWARARRDASIYSLMLRLVCSECGQRNPVVDVEKERR